MAKKAEAITEVTIRYDLFDLPTAQHKAGLAGLVLAIRSLKNRSENDPEAIPPENVPEVVEGPTASGVTLKFTQGTLRTLFDDHYDARTVEVAVKNKWPNTEPKRIDEIVEVNPESQKQTRTKRFIYDQVQPSGHFLRQHLPLGMAPDRDWFKLWRDMLWAIPRGNPQSRAPYEQRAADQHCKDGATAWTDVVAGFHAKSKNAVATKEVAGTLWLGAQANNAESVSFLGQVEQNLLLHFWPLTILISVPQRINADGSQEYMGYVLAIPEVADLNKFVNRFPRLLSGLPTNVRGFRPGHAVIDLPAQGALEFINSVAQIKTADHDDHPIRAISSVEFLHLDKQGNNVKLITSGRVPSDERLLAQYRDIVGTTERPTEYRNPLFKAALILALLRKKPWWGELLPLFMNRDWRFFVRAKDTPSVARDISFLPWFWDDVRTRLKAELDEFNRGKEIEETMTDANPTPGTAPPLSTLINRLVRTYVYRRAEERSGVNLPEKDVDWKSVDPKFNDEKEHVAKSLFLEYRSRRDQAFIDHFAQTLFAVKQYLKDEDQLQLADALLKRTDDVKTLTLMALSANS